MVIQPKMRGFICTTAHPVGCAKAVLEEINYIKKHGQFQGPKNVLVIGASTGYGLASRIAVTFGAGASTIGVFYEKPAEGSRTASAGWYNTAVFESMAHQENHYAKSINGDAFSNEIKHEAANLIRQDLKKIDLIIYSLAAPRRVHPVTGEVFSSVLKPIGQSFTSKTVNPLRGEVTEITLEPATEDEVNNTIAVMGGEDWEMWIDLLAKENLLADGCKTIAYSYIGPSLTFLIYKEGSIGLAKQHLQQTAIKLNEKLQSHKGQAFISINKALVTQASAAIPVVPLYISMLYKVMKEKNIHEGCIEQIKRLFTDNLYSQQPLQLDNEGRIRIDDWEMRADVQQEVAALWQKITTQNITELTDIKGYNEEFHQLFGFNMPDVDYSAEVDPNVRIDSISSEEKV